MTGWITALATAQPSLSAHLRWLDWVVLVGYLALVSFLGVWLAGKQQSMSDFFRGGGKLPWWAVTGSIIATIISAVTFVGVPAVTFREGTGADFTYLQLGLIGGLISRLFVSFVLVPAYYRYQVYSPYDYIGARLGPGGRGITTACFTLMGLLAQAARVYLTAIVLKLVLHDQFLAFKEATGASPLAASIIAVGVISILWTMVGGMATVIWTDALLFVVFVVGAIVALFCVASGLEGGLGQVFREGYEAGKFQVFSLSWQEGFDLTEPFTIVAALFAVSFGNIGAYGTDQLTAQRIFCCKDKRDAQKAMLASYAAEGVAALMLLVGVGLWVYYHANPERLFGQEALEVARKPDNIFPVFILTEVPMGLTGLIIAGIFAAAISSLTSILAALAQTTMSAVYLPMRNIDPEAEHDPRQQRELVRVSRSLVVFWGVLLCEMAVLIDVYVRYQEAVGRDVRFLDLALGLASYVIGCLLASFLLAWLPMHRNAYGLIFAAPLSIMTAYASRFHEREALLLCASAGAVLLVAWVVSLMRGRREMRVSRALRTPALLAGIAVMLLMCRYGWFYKYDKQGDIVMVSPPMLNEQGGKVIDADAPSVYYTHPITGEVLTDPQGQPIENVQARPVLLDTSLREPVKQSVAWPWYAVIGGLMAFVFGYLLGDRYDPPEDAVVGATRKPQESTLAASAQVEHPS